MKLLRGKKKSDNFFWENIQDARNTNKLGINNIGKKG